MLRRSRRRRSNNERLADAVGAARRRIPSSRGRPRLAGANKAAKLLSSFSGHESYHRVLRVARTLADLEAGEGVRRIHIAEALSFRRVVPGRRSVLMGT